MTSARLAPPLDTVVAVSGELAAETVTAYAIRVECALRAGYPILVDLGDCTFIDGRGVRFLAASYDRATRAGIAFFVVLPFSAAPSVRRMLLEFLPDLAPLPIIPRRNLAPVGPTTTNDRAAGGDTDRLRRLRAGVWEAGSRREQLLADRDELILRQREALEAYRAASARRGRP